MNFLAHIYLSGNSDQIMIGNFIGDYVKGKKYRKYPEHIKKGILLHRNIDSFTDNSPVPKRVKSLLKPYYRKYSGIVIDMFYDHFLANNWGYFSNNPLEDFVSEFYELLYRYFDFLPERVQNFVPHMVHHNRILSYRDIQGLYHAMKVMVRTTSLPDKTDDAIMVLNDNYSTFNDNFLEFFPTLINYVKEQFQIDLQYSFNSQM